MFKRGLISLPQRGSQIIATSHALNNKMGIHLMQGRSNASGNTKRDILGGTHFSPSLVRTVTTQQHAGSHEHSKHGSEGHKEQQQHHEEELSTDYKQFNFIESPKETIVSVKTIRKYWELIPLLVVLAIAGGAGVLFMGYSFFTKHDVMRTSKQRHGEDKPWYHANPEKTGKLYVPYEGARRIPELEQLKKVLNE